MSLLFRVSFLAAENITNHADREIGNQKKQEMPITTALVNLVYGLFARWCHNVFVCVLMVGVSRARLWPSESVRQMSQSNANLVMNITKQQFLS